MKLWSGFWESCLRLLLGGPKYRWRLKGKSQIATVMQSSHVSTQEQTEAILDAANRYEQYNMRGANNVTMGRRVYQRILQETYTMNTYVNVSGAGSEKKGMLYGMAITVDGTMDPDSFNVYYAEGIRTEPIYAPFR